jgi:hypothetical protein
MSAGSSRVLVRHYLPRSLVTRDYLPRSVQVLVRHVVECEHGLTIIHLGHEHHDGHVRAHQLQVTPRHVVVQRLKNKGNE